MTWTPSNGDKEIVIDVLGEYCIPKTFHNQTADEVAAILLQRLHERNERILGHAKRLEDANIRRVNDLY